jgi:hypothetical protein
LRHVEITVDGMRVRRPLHFLGFGNLLHDELVRGWAAKMKPVWPVLQVVFPADHPVGTLTGSHLFLIRLSLLDPAQAIPEDALLRDHRGRMRDVVEGASPEKTKELLTPFMQRLDRELEADVRWIRSHLTARLWLDGLRHDGTTWEAVTDDLVGDLLNPIAGGPSNLPTSNGVNATAGEEQAASDAVQRLKSLDTGVAGRAWSHLYPAFDAALDLRIATARIEAADADALARARLEDAERRLEMARERGMPGQITRATSVRAEVLQLLELSELLGRARLAWLEGCRSAVRSLPPVQKGLVLFRPRVLR